MSLICWGWAVVGLPLFAMIVWGYDPPVLLVYASGLYGL